MFCCCNRKLPKIIDAKDLQAQIDYLNEAVLIQAKIDQQEAKKRREQIERTRHELALRIQELENITSLERQELLSRLEESTAEYQRRISAITSELSSQVILQEELKAEVLDNKALIQHESEVRADAFSAEVLERQRLEASVREDIRASVEREAIARANAYEAEALERERLEAKVGRDIIAAIETEALARANADEAEALIRQQLITQISSDIAAAIEREAIVRATADEAEISIRERLTAQIADDIRAAIENEALIRASADEAETQARQSMSVQVASNTAAIEQEQRLRATADSVEAEARQRLEVKIGNDISAAITKEAIARANGDRAEAIAREQVSTQVDNNHALILEERKARSDFQSASAQENRQLIAQLGDLSEGILNNAKSIHDGEEWRRKSIALVREELYAEITAEGEARAGRELEILAAISENSAAIQQEQQARANADEAEARSREALDADLRGEITAAVTTERDARVNADNAIARDVTNLEAEVENNAAEIRRESQAIVDLQNSVVAAADKRELIARLDNLDEAVLTNSTTINNEGEWRRKNIALAREELRAEITAEREARATRELELLAAIDGNSSAIQQEQQARANAIESEAHSREVLSVQVIANTNAIANEEKARISSDTDISERITVLTADVTRESKALANLESVIAYDKREVKVRLDNLDEAVLNNAASITNEGENRRTNIALAREELHAEITAEKIATAKRELELYTAIEANSSAIQQEQLARTDAISSEAHSREILESKVNTNTAAIQTEAQTRAAADSATANTIQTLRSDVNSNASAIQTEQTARATADGALSSRIDTLVTEVDNNAAAILKEQETRVDHENAAAYDKREIQARLTNLDEAVLNNAATIQETGEARRQSIAFAREELHAEITAEGVARAKRELELSAAIEANSSAIQEEQTARANADSAEAQARQNLATQVGVNRNLIDQEVIARTNADSALSTRTSTLENTVNNSTTGLVKRVTTVETSLNGKASISDVETLQTVVGNSNSGLVKRVTTLESDISGKASVSSVETLQTTVSGHTTSIQTLNSVKNGVTGRHYVKIDNNGYVVGTELYNGGADQSSFVVSADHFNVRNPKNANNILDYNSSTGTLTLRNLVADSAVIQDASIMRAKIGGNQITSSVGYVSATSSTINTAETVTACTITSSCEKNAVIVFSGVLCIDAHPNGNSSYAEVTLDVNLYCAKSSTSKTNIINERINLPFIFETWSTNFNFIPISGRYTVPNSTSAVVFKLDLTNFVNVNIDLVSFSVVNLNAITLYR